MIRAARIAVVALCLVILPFQVFGESADEAVQAAFSKLDTLKSYRIRTTITPGSQVAEQMEMAKQMGMDMALKPVVQEVVNPNLRKMTMEVPLVSAPSMPSMSDLSSMKNMPQNMPPTGGMQMKMMSMKT